MLNVLYYFWKFISTLGSSQIPLEDLFYLLRNVNSVESIDIGQRWILQLSAKSVAMVAMQSVCMEWRGGVGPLQKLKREDGKSCFLLVRITYKIK